jgi:hypothetical protein
MLDAVKSTSHLSLKQYDDLHLIYVSKTSILRSRFLSNIYNQNCSQNV